METNSNFITRKPKNSFLAEIVDYYFFIDISVSELSRQPEFIIPFPRITFGYFFEHPFLVSNLSKKETVTTNIAISKISTQKIVVQPITEKIKIIGAHGKPFALAYLTKEPVNKLPWLINTEELFGTIATDFIKRISTCTNKEQMFDEVERVFTDNVLIRDLSLITEAIRLIEENAGSIDVTTLSKQLSVSDRTLRNHFYDHIGCSPKEYLRIVKMKQVAYQLKYQDKQLSDITYENEYFDQAHFINEVKNLTGYSPGHLRKKIPHFRFLQF